MWNEKCVNQNESVNLDYKVHFTIDDSLIMSNNLWLIIGITTQTVIHQVHFFSQTNVHFCSVYNLILFFKKYYRDLNVPYDPSWYDPPRLSKQGYKMTMVKSFM